MRTFVCRLAFFALPAWALGGCASGYLRLAPPSASEPVIPAPVGEQHPAPSSSTSGEPAAGSLVDEGSAVQEGRRYGLPELVELAAASNPETRIVWQRARQAALAVGVAHSSYWPTLSAVAIGAYQHSVFPLSTLSLRASPWAHPEFLPGISVPGRPASGTSGHVGVDTFEVLPFLALRWQALDFSRGPAVKAAEQTSVAANLVFVGEHQRLLFQVATAFFRLGAARAQVRVAAGSPRAHPDHRPVRRGALRPRAGDHGGGGRGAPRGRPGRVRADRGQGGRDGGSIRRCSPRWEWTRAWRWMSRRSPVARWRTRFGEPVEAYLKTALASRPDLLVADAHAARADALVDQADSAYLPSINLVGTGGLMTLGAKVGDGSFKTVNDPNVTALASLEWLLLDGGAREGGVEIARARRDEAELERRKLRNTASQEVLSAYDEANAALARYRAALALERTAAVADEATAKSYQTRALDAGRRCQRAEGALPRLGGQGAGLRRGADRGHHSHLRRRPAPGRLRHSRSRSVAVHPRKQRGAQSCPTSRCRILRRLPRSISGRHRGFPTWWSSVAASEVWPPFSPSGWRRSG